MKRWTARTLAASALFALLFPLIAASACRDLPDTSSEVRRTEVRSVPARHDVTIVASRELGTLKARVDDDQFAGVRCGVCHSLPTESAPAQRPEELEEFHTDMQFTHGDLTCNACHHPDDRDLLRLADGQAIEFSDTMTLCGQCHGMQMRDYRRGAHGGMKGYWDLSAGPRTRNNCVNCHDPHDPPFPAMLPAAPPRDRFMKPGGDHHGEDVHE